MLNYVNSIFCAYNPVENNYVIKMRQDEPIDPADPDAKSVSTDISSVVISRELALQLAQNITVLCKQDNP